MPKHIVIHTCMDCPHKDHHGAFGRVGFVPVCRKTGMDLGYTVSVNNPRVLPTAVYDGEIPMWCPLPDGE